MIKKLVALILLLFVEILFAQNSPITNSINTYILQDTVVVTSSRSSEKNLNVAATINSKSKDEIKLDSPIFQKELFNSLAGVRISQTGSVVGHMTSIRMPINTGPYYLFLQDGIPVQSSGFFNHNGLAYTNFSSTGKVEVLKGAGTALYGSDAIAATVNVMSKLPDLTIPFSIGLFTGSYGLYNLNASSNLKVSNNSLFRISTSFLNSKGWRDHTAHSRGELTLLNSTTINRNNLIKVIFSGNYTDAEMAGSLIGLDQLKNNTTDVGDIKKTLDKGIDIKRKFDFARLSMEWSNFTINNLEINNIFYLRYNRNRYIATWQNNLPQNDSKQQTIGFLHKSSYKTKQFSIIGGMDFEFTKSNLAYIQLFDFTPSGWGSSVPKGNIYNYDVSYLAFAPYLQGMYKVLSNLTLNAGIRFDINNFDYTNNLQNGQYANSTYLRPGSDKDYSFTHLSPKVSLSYRLARNQLLYARFANGFRIPQATRLYSLRTNNIDFDLEPETSNTYELGYKNIAAILSLDIAAYYMIIDNTIIRRQNKNKERYYENGGQTSHKGVEISVGTRITNFLIGKIAYSYSEHKFIDDIKYGNNFQTSAPKNLANIRLFFTPKFAKGFTALLEYEFVDKFWMDEKNTIPYDGYNVINIKTSYDIYSNLTVYGRITNLTDKIYAENATYSYGKEKYTPAAPRQFFIGLNYRW